MSHDDGIIPVFAGVTAGGLRAYAVPRTAATVTVAQRPYEPTISATTTHVRTRSTLRSRRPGT